MRLMRCLMTWLPLAVAAAAAGPPLQSGLNPETGTYVFQHYSAKQYGASPQNWDIAQDHRGVMYFANLDGLLEFDGNSWRLLRLPGKSFVRSVSVDSQGTVYVGGGGEFGLLKPDATGTMAFVSLTGRIPKQDRAFARRVENSAYAAGSIFQHIQSTLPREQRRNNQSLAPRKEVCPGLLCAQFALRSDGRNGIDEDGLR